MNSKVFNLDTSIFQVLSAASENDRMSFLRLQKIVRTYSAEYTYLEIGSEVGGTLVPHLQDCRCKHAISVDLRVSQMPDERGVNFNYVDNTTARMLSNLQKYIPIQFLEKLFTFDVDIADVKMLDLSGRPDLVLIDGEHTNTACFSDFVNVFPLIKENAIISFHDANLISDAIQNIEKMLNYLNIEYATVFLPDHVAAIGLRQMARPIHDELSKHAQNRTQYLEKSRREKVEMIISMRQNTSKMWSPY